MSSFLNKFRFYSEKEDFDDIFTSIDNGVTFRGANLWILICAIFVASLGLNVNSTAVIIGAMLISPLMGPIMGIGLGIGINDTALLKKAFYNYFVATIVALVTSTLFFLVSPLDDAHSEILARTAPSIYDVLIALVGGFAGIIATSSKQKGNVIPGVAIATALMPPLCTAGYGLATFRLSFFFGAFYLYIINTVFIALSTFIICRLLHFPYKRLHNPQSEKIARRIVWFVVMLTLLPSIYLGYDLVQRERFTKNANNFINNEGNFPGDYLLNKKIDAKERSILLVYGGKPIDSSVIAGVNKKLSGYNLINTKLEIRQGFAYLGDNKETADQNRKDDDLANAIKQQELYNKSMQQQLDSIAGIAEKGRQVYAELKAQYPVLKNAIVEPVTIWSDSAKNNTGFLVALNLSKPITNTEKTKIINWLQVRLKVDSIRLVTQF